MDQKAVDFELARTKLVRSGWASMWAIFALLGTCGMPACVNLVLVLFALATSWQALDFSGQAQLHLRNYPKGDFAKME